MKRLPTTRRSAVEVSTAALVEIEALLPEGPLPLLVRPGAERVDLESWARESAELLRQRLLEAGGLLFRGFGVAGVERFEGLVETLAGGLLPYRERATPRSRVGGRVFTSTDYPADQTIELHNENCYATSFPGKIFFHCIQAPRSGGQTPLADTRRVYREIDPGIRTRFEETGVMYVRNFVSGVGLSWQEAFQTDDRDRLERICRESGIETEWLSDEHLRTRQVRPAVARHPETGERIWLNQAVAFHVSTLAPSVRRQLVAELTEEGVPKTTCYGDGTPIDEDTLAALREAYRRATVAFDWQEGDVLMLDNLLVAHGRKPYEGPRQVAVAMAQPVAGEDVWVHPGEAA